MTSGWLRGGLFGAGLVAALSGCAVYDPAPVVYEPAPYYAPPAYSYYPAPYYYAPGPSFSFSYSERDRHGPRRHGHRHWR